MAPRHWVCFSAFIAISLCFLLTESSLPAFDALRINCGGVSMIDSDGFFWNQDTYYLGGIPLRLANWTEFQLTAIESTLRFFRPGDISCYSVFPAPPGRYYIRLGFSRYDVDATGKLPVMKIYIEGVVVAIVDLQATSSDYGEFYRTDFFVSTTDGDLEVCFVAANDGNPLVDTIEVFPADNSSYASVLLGTQNLFLSNALRVNVGGKRVPASADVVRRIWRADDEVSTTDYAALATPVRVSNADVAPNYVPSPVLQTARTNDDGYFSYGYLIEGVSALNKWFICLHFAEIGNKVQMKDRIFDVRVNSVRITNFDIVEMAGNKSFFGVMLVQPFKLDLVTYEKPQNVIISLKKSNGSELGPLLSGIEIYEGIKYGAVKQNVINNLTSGSSTSTRSIIAIIIGSTGFIIVASVVTLFLALWRRQSQELIAMAADPDNDRQSLNVNLGSQNLRNRNLSLSARGTGQS